MRNILTVVSLGNYGDSRSSEHILQRHWRTVRNFVACTIAASPVVTHTATSPQEHPCQLLRLFPWTFPRAFSDDPPAREAGQEVETADLLLSCPTWSCTAPEPFPLRASMREFRRQWSHQRVTVARPIRVDYGNAMVALAFWDCRTENMEFMDLVWRVTGPLQFLDELRVAATSGPPEFAGTLSALMGPGRPPTSLYLCRHEIICD